MRFCNKLAVVLSIAAGAAALLPAQSAKDAPPFRPQPAASYPSHQTAGPLKIAAVKFESDEETRVPFGKLNPNEYGVLPVLLVVENTGSQVMLLDRMGVRYQAPGSYIIEPTPAQELPFLIAPKRPNTGPRYPLPIPRGRRKNPLSGIELDARSWAAKSLLGGESAHGFFYFQTRHRRDAFLFITGIREGGTGKELFYVEVPVDNPLP
jgi:hypothetical protein